MNTMSENDSCSDRIKVLKAIFAFLPANEIVKCRTVCSKWRSVIDGTNLWLNVCRNNFPNIYESAYYKSSHLSWYHLFRSLILWPQLGCVQESRIDFCTAKYLRDEIKKIVLLKDSIGVQKKRNILYYNRNTLRYEQNSILRGKFLHYFENDDVLLLLFEDLMLHIIWKYKPISNNIFESIGKVTMFIAIKNVVYYVRKLKKLCKCEVVKGKITTAEIAPLPPGASALTVINGFVHIVTSKNYIYKLVDKEFVVVWNFCHRTTSKQPELNKYLLQPLEWTVKFERYTPLITTQSARLRPNENFTAVLPYGLVTFAGTNWGKLYIYYTPKISKVTDLSWLEPLKIYDLTQNHDHVPHLTCRIIQIDVVESINSHTIYVAMPKRITTVHISHEKENTLLSEPGCNGVVDFRSSALNLPPQISNKY